MKLTKCVKLDRLVEKQLLIDYSQTKSQKIKDRLFEAYYPLVKKTAYSIYKRSPKSKVDLADLISDGSCGLLMAIDKFDINKADNLYAVAHLWIREYVHGGVMRNLSSVRDISTNSNTRTLYHRFRRTLRTLELTVPLSDENRQEVSTKLNVPISDVLFFENVMHDFVDVDELNNFSSGNDEETDNGNSIDMNNLRRFINNEIMPHLSQKEQYIIKTRILTEERVEDVASHFDHTKASIYQIEKKLKEHIRVQFINRYHNATP